MVDQSNNGEIHLLLSSGKLIDMQNDDTFLQSYNQINYWMETVIC